MHISMSAMMIRPLLLPALFAITLSTHGMAQGADVPAKELAASMMPKPSTGFFMKMKMDLAGEGKAKTTLQIQVKGRRIDQTTDLLYQIQFPKDRQGEGLLIRWKGGKFVHGHTFKPGGAPEPLSAKDLFQPLFGSALTYHDTDFGFWGWGKHADKGSANVMDADCRVIDSEPLEKNPSGYHRIRSYIDKEKLAPLVIEKFTDKGLAVTIRTDDLAKSDDGRFIARQYSATRASDGTTTTVTGTKLEAKEYPDSQFTREAMMEVKPK